MAWSAILAVGRAEWRWRWRALAGLGVVAAVAAGLVTAAVATARRTGTAYGRLEEATRVDDARAQVLAGPEVAAALADLSVVRQSWTGGLAVGQIAGTTDYRAVVSGPPWPEDLFQPITIAGRLFRDDVANEAVVTEAYARSVGVGPGEVLPLQFLSREELDQFDTGFGAPDGPSVDLEVTGVVRIPGGPGSIAPVLAGPAFATRYGPEATVGREVLLRLQDGSRSIPELAARLDELPGPPGAVEVDYPSRAAAGVDATAGVLVGGLLVGGAVVAAGGVLALGQGLSRHFAGTARDQAVEAALGLTGGERWAAHALPAVVTVAVVGAGGAAGALVAGGIEPMGAIARYEPNPGWAPNMALAALGGLGSGAVAFGLAVLAVRRAGRRRPAAPARPSQLAERASVLGARPPLLLGLRLALDPGRGPTALPVRSTLAGVVLMVAGVSAVATFGASLDRLVATPARYGWPGDFVVVDVSDEILEGLVADGRLASVTETTSATAGVADRQVPAYAFDPAKGTPDLSPLSGRMPAGPDEVALGTRLADQVEQKAGGSVEALDPGGERRRLRVVGVGLWPPTSGEELGANVILSPEGLERFGLGQSFREALVEVAGDPEPVAADLAERFELQRRELPVDVDNLRQLADLPLAVGAALALMGMLALGHAVTVVSRRRGREIGVLRTVGFTPSEVGRSLVVMAVTVAVGGVVIGVPIGLSVGRLVWTAVADGAAVAPGAVVPVTLLAAIGAAVVVAAVAIAAAPARRASRLPPAAVLRTE